MKSDTGILCRDKDDRTTTETAEAKKHVGFRNADLSLFLRNHQETESKPTLKPTKEAKHDHDPSTETAGPLELLSGIGLLAIPGVGPLLAAAALVKHDHDVSEKKEESETAGDSSDEAFRLTEKNVRDESGKSE